MTRDDVREAAQIMLAFADGAELECRALNTEGRPVGDWVPAKHLELAIAFNFDEFAYRVKPKAREWWIAAPDKQYVASVYTYYPEHLCHIADLEIVHVREILDD